jgi:hypothetical protein
LNFSIANPLPPTGGILGGVTNTLGNTTKGVTDTVGNTVGSVGKGQSLNNVS